MYWLGQKKNILFDLQQPFILVDIILLLRTPLFAWILLALILKQI